MKRRSDCMYETEVKEALIKWLGEQNLEIMEEVALRVHGSKFLNPIIDVCAEDNEGVVSGYECKSDGGNNNAIYRGIGQAVYNKFFVNKSYLVIPEKWLERVPANGFEYIGRQTGVGILMCNNKGINRLVETKIEEPQFPVSLSIGTNMRYPERSFSEEPIRWMLSPEYRKRDNRDLCPIMSSRVQENGTITVPKGFRDKYAIRPGSIIYFEITKVVSEEGKILYEMR